MLLVLSGRPASGKTTAAGGVLAHYPGSRMLSSTTWDRPARANDLPDDFEIVTEREFDELEVAGTFLWTAEAHGNHFGTRKSLVDQALDSAMLYVAVLVPSAAVSLHQYSKKRGQLFRVKYVYLHVDNEDTLRRRLKARAEKMDPAYGVEPERTAKHEEDIENRLALTRLWYHEARYGQYTVPYRFINTTVAAKDQTLALVKEEVDALHLQPSTIDDPERRE